eukprot:TRINITY_DN62635_c0_g1_i1.p1 TRINITY_DN62635_c0_g1~~TRINITY_DN62635_c0_g1_i1.p1  ORF type:complete len:292 (+),score=98.11 TRINITY_DN62635_c0_g1_i1:147-1022(+)
MARRREEELRAVEARRRTEQECVERVQKEKEARLKRARELKEHGLGNSGEGANGGTASQAAAKKRRVDETELRGPGAKRQRTAASTAESSQSLAEGLSHWKQQVVQLKKEKEEAVARAAAEIRREQDAAEEAADALELARERETELLEEKLQLQKQLKAEREEKRRQFEEFAKLKRQQTAQTLRQQESERKEEKQANAALMTARRRERVLMAEKAELQKQLAAALKGQSLLTNMDSNQVVAAKSRKRGRSSIGANQAQESPGTARPRNKQAKLESFFKGNQPGGSASPILV